MGFGRKNIFSCAAVALCLAGFASESQAQTKVVVDPGKRYQVFEGWGTSLCWWAVKAGAWSESNRSKLLGAIADPDTGLGYTIFRYNIGGGDDPANAHCTPHHMGEGKGLRAEMEGFKDSSADDYHWDRDAGQRNEYHTPEELPLRRGIAHQQH